MILFNAILSKDIQKLFKNKLIYSTLALIRHFIIENTIFININYRQIEMSRFRGQMSRSPYRTPPRLYQTERDAIIEEQVRLKSALKMEADNRRVHDELAMLQIKVRHTAELEDRCENLLRQNNQLARDNDQLSRQLNERKYEIQRLRAVSSQQNEREAIKNGQLYQMNKSLELQIQLLKKQRVQSNRLYEQHIDKLERMLDQKVVELDSMTLRCSDLNKELEIAGIRFQEEKNHLKNLMTRTEHELERELEYTKEKTTSQKFSEIDSMKRNYSAQVALLEDEISKLKILNSAKADQFQSQLAENKALRKRHQQEIRMLASENDDLRARMMKLEELNRSEVENIQIKYNNYHNQGTSNLKQQYGREMKLLLDEIDKLTWLTAEKNNEIQNLVSEKRQLRKFLDETQLQLSSEIESLKNRIHLQESKFAEDNHAHMTRINSLCDQLQRQSDGYHCRAKQFRGKIDNLQAQINDKQNILDKVKSEAKIREKQLTRSLNDANSTIEKVKRELADSQEERKSQNQRNQEYKAKAESTIADISQKLNAAEVKLEQTQDKLAREMENSNGSQDLLKIQIESLKKNVSILEDKLSEQQNNHSNQMKELSANVNLKLKNLQAAQRKALDELQESKKQQIDALNVRIQKLIRDKEYAESQLKRYIQMYENLEKYFKEPHDGALFDEKSKNSIYEVLGKVSQSSIHIF